MQEWSSATVDSGFYRVFQLVRLIKYEHYFFDPIIDSIGAFISVHGNGIMCS